MNCNNEIKSKFVVDTHSSTNNIVVNEITININVGDNVDLEKLQTVMNMIKTNIPSLDVKKVHDEEVDRQMEKRNFWHR